MVKKKYSFSTRFVLFDEDYHEVCRFEGEWESTDELLKNSGRTTMGIIGQLWTFIGNHCRNLLAGAHGLSPFDGVT